MHQGRGDRKIGESEPVLRNPLLLRKVMIENARGFWEQCLAACNLEQIGCVRTAD
jgi:hypothetical protein